MQVVAAGPPFDENPSSSFVVLVVIIVLGIVAVGVLLYILNKTRLAITRGYYRPTKKELRKETTEFSSDSERSVIQPSA